jgi:hypothetical protein
MHAEDSSGLEVSRCKRKETLLQNNIIAFVIYSETKLKFEKHVHINHISVIGVAEAGFWTRM